MPPYEAKLRSAIADAKAKVLASQKDLERAKADFLAWEREHRPELCTEEL